VARITHPQPQIGTTTDRIGGVVFRDGFAEVDLTDDPNLRDAYLMHGYGIEETADLPAEDFAVVELPDGTIIGDGKSIATLHKFAEPEKSGEHYIPAASARRGRK
jgi:hypothetical protein